MESIGTHTGLAGSFLARVRARCVVTLVGTRMHAHRPTQDRYHILHHRVTTLLVSLTSLKMEVFAEGSWTDTTPILESNGKCECSSEPTTQSETLIDSI